MDVEIATVLNKKPYVLPHEPPKGLYTMKLGRIQRKDWSVAFSDKGKPDANYHRVVFYFTEKDLYSSSSLEYIVDFVGQYKANSAADKKCFSNMINRYIFVHKTLLGIMPKLFKVQKRQQQ